MPSEIPRSVSFGGGRPAYINVCVLGQFELIVVEYLVLVLRRDAIRNEKGWRDQMMAYEVHEDTLSVRRCQEAIPILPDIAVSAAGFGRSVPTFNAYSNTKKRISDLDFQIRSRRVAHCAVAVLPEIADDCRDVALPAARLVKEL